MSEIGTIIMIEDHDEDVESAWVSIHATPFNEPVMVTVERNDVPNCPLEMQLDPYERVLIPLKKKFIKSIQIKMNISE